MKHKCVLWENVEISVLEQVVNIHYDLIGKAEIKLFFKFCVFLANFRLIIQNYRRIFFQTFQLV
jgi:hypothetical protein